MRVLIVNTNRERSPETVVPLGACCVASAVRTAGHDVRFVDLTFARSPVKTAVKVVKEFKPDVTGFSIRNVDNSDMLNPRSCLKPIREIVSACRDAGAENIILGGSAVTSFPGPILSYMESDWAIVGEGEESFTAFLEALELNSDPLAIPGVAAVRNGQAQVTLPVPVKQFTSPAIEEWLNLQSYRQSEASLPVQTKRGCPFSCSYCIYPKLEGDGIRFRDPTDVAADVERAESLGFRTVEFVDSVFNVPEDHTIACCESITQLNKRVPLQTLELNPAASSLELVKAMNAAEFAAVGCTVESGSDAILASLNKGFDTEHLRQAAHAFKSLDALKLWIFMLGSPGETETTVRETASFIEKCLGPRDLVYIGCGVRILPGTRVHTNAIEEGVVSADDDLFMPKFYFSPRLTPDLAMSIIINSKFPSSNIISLGDGNNNVLPLFQRFAHCFGMSPPYWRWAPMWNRLRRPWKSYWLRGS